MSSMDELKRELEEVKKLKETLKDEIEEIRRDRVSERRRPGRRTVILEPPRIDLSGITDSLEDMMEDIGEQISNSMRGVENIGEKFRWEHARRTRSSRKRRSDIEAIPPERIASVISPLGSEERLKILDYLKEGARTFNELEEKTGRTGSSLTHHLSLLVDAGYVVKGEVRGTYFITVEGRLAYRLSQWLTSRLERELDRNGDLGDGEADPVFEDGEEFW